MTRLLHHQAPAPRNPPTSTPTPTPTHAQGLRFTVWPSPTGHAYPKLRLKYKPNLISMAGGCERMPVTDPSARATPLEPAQWAEMIANQKVRRLTGV